MVDVTVLRVFTDADGRFGNPLGVVDADAVAPGDRQALATELGYSETVFVDLPAPGTDTASARIFTPAAELPFAGHPTVGAAWWLRERGTPIRTLQVPAGPVRIDYESLPDGEFAVVTARAEWAPDFVLHEVATVADVLAAKPDEFGSDAEHYVWAWADREAGAVRSRCFVPVLGVPEDEATGSAAARLTDHVGRDLLVTQGRGSQIRTWWDPTGWVKIAGRVVDDGVRQIG